MMRQHNRGIVAALVACSAGLGISAGAVEVGKGAVATARAGGGAPAARPAVTEGSLRDGVLTRVDVANGRIEIGGQWHALVWGQTQIFQQGHSARPDVLRVGQSVRYTAMEADNGSKRVGVIYVP